MSLWTAMVCRCGSGSLVVRYMTTGSVRSCCNNSLVARGCWQIAATTRTGSGHLSLNGAGSQPDTTSSPPIILPSSSSPESAYGCAFMSVRPSRLCFGCEHRTLSSGDICRCTLKRGSRRSVLAAGHDLYFLDHPPLRRGDLDPDHLCSLMLPAKWQQLRTGHWAVEHFLAYFAAASIVCLGWQHPFVVAGMLILLAALLEVLQNLQPNHPPNLPIKSPSLLRFFL